MEMSGQLHAPAALTLKRNFGTHFIGDWVGTRVGLDAVAKRKCPGRVGSRNLS